MEILYGVVVFTLLILILASIILAARKWLVPEGDVTITVNEEK